MLLAFFAAVAMELGLVSSASYRFVDRRTRAERESHLREVRSDLSSLGLNQPRILNLSDLWITYSITDRCYVNDPVLYSILWEEGVLSNRHLIDSMMKQQYDLIIIPRNEGGARSSNRAWAEVTSAAENSYRVETLGAYRYLRPASPDSG
jgi:hypothetical protein